MEHAKIISRIKKLLALSKSSNPNEAAQALQFAQTLIEKHNIDPAMLQLSDVGEVLSKLSLRAMPSLHTVKPSHIVAAAFGCSTFTSQSASKTYRFVFYGLDDRAAVADYTFAVLNRQLTAARKQFMATLNARLKRSTKTRRADLFARAWLSRVEATVVAFAQTESERALLLRWQSVNYPGLRESSVSATKPRRNEMAAAVAGYAAADGVTLNHGMSTARPVPRIATS